MQWREQTVPSVLSTPMLVSMPIVTFTRINMPMRPIGKHVKSTGPEIWSQTKQKVTHFVAGLGTTGTFIGTSRFLQTKGVHCVSVEPDNPMHGLEGWKHMETAIVPKIYDNTVANDTMTADTIRSYEVAKAATKYLGLFLSPSAAANLDAALRLADELTHGVVVTVFLIMR